MRDDGEKAYPTATFRELPFGARQRRGICILAPEHSAEHPERSFGTGISRLERNPTVIREAVRIALTVQSGCHTAMRVVPREHRKKI